MDLEFSGVNVDYGKTRVLHGIYGRCNRGEMLAVLGPSGTGKSTLLNAITGRVPVTSGNITIGNKPLNKRQRRRIAYVMQSEVFFPNLTLYETLVFHAMLKLPDSIPVSKKMERVEEMIDEFDLRKCSGTIIGNAQIPGLSGGEKKRTNIACEFITNADIIVIDEPTTGLDAATAVNIIKTLKCYTESHQKIVIITIHQPSSQVYQMFTKLLLITSGKVGYFGSADNLVPFLSNVGLECHVHYNPAEYLLQCLKENKTNEELILKAASQLSTRFHSTNIEPNEQMAENGGRSTGSENHCYMNQAYIDCDVEKISSVKIPNFSTTDAQHNSNEETFKWPSGLWTQYKTLVKRQFKQRNRVVLSPAATVHKITLAMLMGLFWFQLPKTDEYVMYRQGAIFIIEAHWVFLAAALIPAIYHLEFPVICRERSSGMYRLSAFFLSTITCEFHLVFLFPVIHMLIMYWMIGFTSNVWIFLAVEAIIIMTISASLGFVWMITLVNKNLTHAMLFANAFATYVAIGGGVIVRNEYVWFEWTKYTSPVFYSVEAFLKLEFVYGTGFGNSTESTYQSVHATPNYTEINTGLTPSDYLRQHLKESHAIWIDAVVLLAMIFITRIICYFILRIKDKNVFSP